jgi:protein O-mannosyl-transferase
MKHFSIMNNYKQMFILLLLVLTVLIVFWDVQDYDFVHYDDQAYVIENSYVHSGLTSKSISWAFTTGHTGYWHPLTWLSLMLDYELFKLNPGGYHWTNVMFHIANTLLLFLVLNRITGRVWRSSFVAVLFAVHPLHVESVAWISERKDVLSTFFWILTLWFYVLYVEHPGFKRYIWMLVFFVLGLLSKPMVVTLPFVLLLLDYWPLKRQASFHTYDSRLKVSLPAFSKRPLPPSAILILEKIPLFILSLVVSVVTFLVSKNQQVMATFQAASLQLRIENVLVSYATYIAKMFWPQNMAVFYPYPGALPLWQVAWSLILLLGITLFVLFQARRRPYLVVGWLWYLGTLVPVIGLVQVGSQAMADRYTYISFIGLFVMVTWGVVDYLISMKYRKVILVVLSSLTVSILMILSWQQVRHWQNTTTLFTHALLVTERNYVAHNGLGAAFMSRNMPDEAAFHFRESLKIAPSYLPANHGIGSALIAKGLCKAAIPYYTRIINMKPDDSLAYYNMGYALTKLNRLHEAEEYYRIAVSLEPNNASFHNNMGVLFINQGKIEEALSSFQKVLKLNPSHAGAHNNLAMILVEQGREEEAISHFKEAIRLQPDYANAQYNLGMALRKKGLLKEAESHINKAMQINPGVSSDVKE